MPEIETASGFYCFTFTTVVKVVSLVCVKFMFRQEGRQTLQNYPWRLLLRYKCSGNYASLVRNLAAATAILEVVSSRICRQKMFRLKME